MNAQIRKSAAGVFVASLALLASGAALAEDFARTDFRQLTMYAQKSVEIDHSGYQKLNLSAIGNTAWVATNRGAQGPLRDETDAAAMRARAAEQDLRQRLGPVGGQHTS